MAANLERERPSKWLVIGLFLVVVFVGLFGAAIAELAPDIWGTDLRKQAKAEPLFGRHFRPAQGAKSQCKVNFLFKLTSRQNPPNWSAAGLAGNLFPSAARQVENQLSPTLAVGAPASQRSLMFSQPGEPRIYLAAHCPKCTEAQTCLSPCRARGSILLADTNVASGAICWRSKRQRTQLSGRQASEWVARTRDNKERPLQPSSSIYTQTKPNQTPTYPSIHPSIRPPLPLLPLCPVQSSPPTPLHALVRPPVYSNLAGHLSFWSRNTGAHASERPSASSSLHSSSFVSIIARWTP